MGTGSISISNKSVYGSLCPHKRLMNSLRRSFFCSFIVISYIELHNPLMGHGKGGDSLQSQKQLCVLVVDCLWLMWTESGCCICYFQSKRVRLWTMSALQETPNKVAIPWWSLLNQWAQGWYSYIPTVGRWFWYILVYHDECYYYWWLITLITFYW